MKFEPQIEEHLPGLVTKFGVKKLIGLVTVHVLRFLSFRHAAVESADQFWSNLAADTFLARRIFLQKIKAEVAWLPKLTPQKSAYGGPNQLIFPTFRTNGMENEFGPWKMWPHFVSRHQLSQLMSADKTNFGNNATSLFIFGDRMSFVEKVTAALVWWRLVSWCISCSHICIWAFFKLWRPLVAKPVIRFWPDFVTRMDYSPLLVAQISSHSI